MSAGDEPAEHHLYSDSSAVYDWIIQQLQVPPDRIILYGKSLGTAATIDLGTRVRAIGMILVCPLASGARVVFPTMKNFITDGVFCPSISKIGKVKAPVFIMHGTKDEVIAVCNGQDLYEECKANHPLPPVLVDGAAAHDMDTYGHTLTHARPHSCTRSLPPHPQPPPPSPPLSHQHYLARLSSMCYFIRCGSMERGIMTLSRGTTQSSSRGFGCFSTTVVRCASCKADEIERFGR